MGTDTSQNGEAEIQPGTAEAVCHAPVERLIGSQQIHGGVIGRSVSAGRIAHAGIEELHAGFVPVIQPKGTRIGLHQLGQAADQLTSRMHHGVYSFLVGHGPGFNAFCDIRADLVRTFLSAPELRAEFAVHIFFLVGKSSDIHETSCG